MPAMGSLEHELHGTTCLDQGLMASLAAEVSLH